VIEFCGIPLAHRIVNGSGTFDAIAARRAFGDAVYTDFPFAAFVSKTVTLAPRQGNPPPRLWELPGGLINSIGLPNKGLEGYLREDLPQLAELPVPLIVNVMGSTREDVARLVAAFAERDEVAAIELNVSCPNVRTGLVMGADPRELAALLDHVRPHSAKPLIVKLTPNCASPADVAAAAEQHGADAVSLINTLRGMAMDPHRPARPGSAAAPAACRVRPCARSPSARFARSATGSRSPSWGWGACSRATTQWTFAGQAQIWWPSALNRSATP
jgi:dihydroorotate dehydrogenase (NAD+) catalytic subunit